MTSLPMVNRNVSFRIDGDAVAKGRPRFTRGGQSYTPKKSAHWEAFAKLKAVEAMAGEPPMVGPVRLDLHVWLAVPRSWSRRRTTRALEGTIRPTSRPDLDNFEKAVLDAFNGVVFRDDSQVVEVHKWKAYAEHGYVEVTVIEQAAERSSKVPKRAAA